MITERSQRRAIYDRFVAKSAPAALDVARFDEPWRTIYLLAERNDSPIVGMSPLMTAIQAIAEDNDHALELRRQIEAASTPLHFPTLEEIGDDLAPIEWLWENWLPRGMLSILGAFQGAGKSYFVLDLARAVIRSEQWPDGTAVTRSGPVVYVEAEAIPQVTNERAQKLGIDRKRLYLLMAEPGQILDLTQRSWQDTLIDMVTDLKPELVIIDSLSTISTNGQNSVEDTTRLLMFLSGLARHGNCGMLVLHHLRKPQTSQLTLPGISIHDFRGSSHITAMARTVMGLSVMQSAGAQFSLNGARRVEISKTNLGPYPEPIGLALVEDATGTRFEYGEVTTDSARSSRDKCAEWLVEILTENGPTKPAEIVEMGAIEGFERSMIYRARKTLGDAIINTDGRQSPKNQWMLAGDVAD